MIFACAYGFQGPLTFRRHLSVLKMNAIEGLVARTPSDLKSRIKFKLKGSSISTAQFRADLKKELTFFRGCPARFELYSTKAEAALITEGKTANLIKFLDWLRVLELPVDQRKANFQGPSLQIKVTEAKWETYKEELVGFTAPVEAPPLDGIHSSDEIDGTKTMEGQSMAGTDESV